MGHIVRDLSIVKNSCSRQKPYNHDLTTTENTKKNGYQYPAKRDVFNEQLERYQEIKAKTNLGFVLAIANN